MGRAKILDFGLAVAGDDHLTPRNSVVGSPGYLSPEQARNDPLDDRTDLYSLGAVLYQMASGKLPLSTDNMASQLIAIICHPVPRVNDRIIAMNNRPSASGVPMDRPTRKELPKPMADLIDELLAKEARRRPRSAAALVERLEVVAQQCNNESQAALQIVTESTRQRSTTKPPTTDAQQNSDHGETATPSNKRFSPLHMAIGASVVLCLVALSWWAMKPKRIASQPIKQNSPSHDSPKPIAVDVDRMKAIAMLTIKSATSEVAAGQAARFKIPVQNQASGQHANPKRIYAKQRTVAKILTKLTPHAGGATLSPTFPLKLRPKQLPGIGETKSIEVFFRTDTLAPGSYDVVFELRTPGNSLVHELHSKLTVTENLDNSELLGFEVIRTNVGDGGDTFVNSKRPGTPANPTLANQAATKPFLEVQKTGTGDGVLYQHAYLEFDLRQAKTSGDQIDRAVLVLTLAKGGHPHKAKILAFGITEPSFAWPDSSEQLTWSQTPSESSITNQRFLGMVELPGARDALEEQVDAIRIHGSALDDFLRSAGSRRVTLVLTCDSWSDRPLRFVSKDGTPDLAPGLAIRGK